MKSILTNLAAVAVMLLSALPAGAKPPLETFVDAPPVRSMTITPDGKHVAWIETIKGVDYVMLRDLASGQTRALTRTASQQANAAHFLTNRYLLLVASKIGLYYGSGGKHRYGGGFIQDIESNRSYPMDDPGIVGPVSEDGKWAYVAGRISAYRVQLSSGNIWGPDLGGHWGEDNWVVSPEGKILVAESFDSVSGRHRFLSVDGGFRKLLLEETAKIPHIEAVGLSPDRSAIIVADSRDAEFASLKALSIKDGTLSEPLFTVDGAEASEAIVDRQGIVRGVEISGVYPRYRFFDAALTEDMQRLPKSFPGEAVWLQDESADWSKLLLLVVGGKDSGRYVLYDRIAKKLIPLSPLRAELAPTDVGEVISIEYPARDGLKIQAILTWPTGVAPGQRKALPMVVLPHGGPEAYDTVGYDSFAQFLANQGYLVLQPNFRGSSGYGAAFRQAGHHQFGRKMQDDITDGVKAVAGMGWADPERICIMGLSYGGYAALMGGAVTPELYKCVVSIEPVTDLPDFLKHIHNRYGGSSQAAAYWQVYLGDPVDDDAELRTWSPTYHAADFKAPVLLIHGENDVTTPVDQSRKMASALKDAGKDIRLIVLPDENHNLMQSTNRTVVFQQVATFLAANLGK